MYVHFLWSTKISGWLNSLLDDHPDPSDLLVLAPYLIYIIVIIVIIIIITAIIIVTTTLYYLNV